MRIFFTGGSGKAGKHVAPYLAEQGHQVTNADLVPLGHPAVDDLRVDLTDAGETYSALAGLATLRRARPRRRSRPTTPSCTSPPCRRSCCTSDATTYATNVLSTYNVLEAATRLGIRKVVFASSETTYGDLLRPGRAAAALRAGRRGAPDGPGGLLRDVEGRRRGDGALVPGPHRRRHLRAADQQRHRAARVRRDVPGVPRRTRRCGGATSSPTSTPATSARWCSAASRSTGWATRSSTSPTPTCRWPRRPQEVRDRFYDGVEVRREMGRDETFYSIDKARELLGYAPQHSWRDLLPDPHAG